MASLKKIVRTCIFCRNKYGQNELIRLRCFENRLILYNNFGRSFYICKECTTTFLNNKNEKLNKKFENLLFRECKNKNEYLIQLKEILIDVR